MSAAPGLAEALRARAQDVPHQPALVEPSGSAWRATSFRELDARADRYAGGLERAGVRAGDRTLYLLRPSADGYAIFYALLRLGAIPVFLDPRMERRRLLACLRSAAPRVIVGVPALHALRVLAPGALAASRLFFVPGRLPLPGTRLLQDCLGEARAPEDTTMPPAAPCFLPFTSGATGRPKAVLCTHGMVRAQLQLMRNVCGWREGSGAVLCYAPFAPYALADGLTAILPAMDFSRPGAARPERLVEAITAHGAACAFAAPIVWMRLVRYCERRGLSLRMLRQAVSAGAPVPLDLHGRLGPLLDPEGDLFTPYGSTEAMPLTAAPGRSLADTRGSSDRGEGTCVGTPLPGVDVRIIAVTEASVPCWSDDLGLPPGAVGEIVVGGAVVSPAYPDLPEETRRAKIRDGDRLLHRTGDLGRLDPAGRLWYCGRTAHRIETANGMLAPTALENIFDAHPAVFRSAVVGMGPRGRQTAVVCLELESGSAFTPGLAEELAGMARDTPYAGMVRRFLPHPGFPVDPRHNSKIQREQLARWAARQ